MSFMRKLRADESWVLVAALQFIKTAFQILKKKKCKYNFVISMLSVCLWIPPVNFWMPEPVFMKLSIYGNWAYLSGVLHKFLSLVCVSVCVSPLSLLGKGLVKCIHLSLLCNSSLKMVPWQWRINGGIIFCLVHVVAKESRWSVLPWTSSSFSSV
jgi:hypothetical protein